MKIIITLNNGFEVETIMNVEQYNLDRETSRNLLIEKIRHIVKVGKQNEKLEL